MQIIQSVLLGIVEGITEFLPVSSTFHLIWTAKIIGVPQTAFTDMFTVVIQGGAILAVIFLFAKDVRERPSILLRVLSSFIPTAVIGLVLYDFIKSILFDSLLISTWVFVLVGVVFLFVERRVGQGKMKLDLPLISVSWRHAILIGVFQSLAILPGVSRAGAVMLGMMILGYRRDDAAKYSFLLSVPTILAASVFDFVEMRDVVFSEPNGMMLLLIGLITSFFTAMLCISWLISYLRRNSLALFGWYRILLGILLILFLTLSP